MVNKLACAAAVALLFTSTAQAEDYSIRSLAGYGKDIQWRYLNNEGDVAGFHYGTKTVYVRGTTNTTYVDEDFSVDYVAPTALGNDGTVYTTTFYYNSGGYAQGIAANGTITRLPILPQTGPNANRGADSVQAVNSHGVAVGAAYNGDGYSVDHGEYVINYPHAVVYQNGQVTDIGTLGGHQASAYSINNQGTIVGWAHTSSGRTDAFIYADGQMTALRENSEAWRINDSGAVAGVTHHFDGWNRWDTAFVYQNGVFTDLAIEGYTTTRVIDLNNSGQLLGYAESRTSGGDFLYENGQTTFLDDLLAQQEGSDGWRISRAYDINDKGEILVYVHNDGQTSSQWESWVLSPGVSPVPEPGTWAMLLAGFSAIGMAARRRQVRT